MHAKLSSKKEIKVGDTIVKVYETPHGDHPGFTVCWRELAQSTDGVKPLRRKRCRKFFSNERDARDFAQRVAIKKENQELQALSIKPDDARIYVAALDTLKPCGIALDAAARELKAAREIVGDYPILQALKFWKTHHDNAIREKRVSEVVEELVNGLEKDGASAVHIREMKRTLGHFANAFETDISDVATQDVNDYLRRLNVSAASRNIYRRKILTLFNYARRSGYLPKNCPTAATESAKAKEPGREIEIYSPDEMLRLLRHASDNLRPFVVLCGFCGLRAAEAMRLDWSEVHFAREMVFVSARKSKTRSRRFAPLPENAAAWLRPLARPNGKVVGTIMVVNALRRLGKRAGVTLKRNGLRRSFCSYRLAVTQNANQVALESGHATNILFKHYRELATEAEAQRWFLIAPTETENVVPMAATAR
jgi:integrase